MFLLKNTTQWRRWGSNPRPLGLELSTLPLGHWAPMRDRWSNVQAHEILVFIISAKTSLGILIVFPEISLWESQHRLRLNISHLTPLDNYASLFKNSSYTKAISISISWTVVECYLNFFFQLSSDINIISPSFDYNVYFLVFTVVTAIYLTFIWLILFCRSLIVKLFCLISEQCVFWLVWFFSYGHVETVSSPS